MPVDTLPDVAVAASRYDVCGCEKLVPVLTTRLVLAGSETTRGDWSVLLALADGRVMSAVA